MLIGTIQPRNAIDVYTRDGFVCLKETSNLGEETEVEIHPDDIPMLVKHLEEARQKCAIASANGE